MSNKKIKYNLKYFSLENFIEKNKQKIITNL